MADATEIESAPRTTINETTFTTTVGDKYVASTHSQPHRIAINAAAIGPTPAPRPARVIALEGNIGVGKSHFCRELLRNEPDTCITLPERPCTPLLELFYANSSKYAFALQIHMLAERRCQYELSHYMPLQYRGAGPRVPAPTVVWDRSLLGDFLFAWLGYLMGNITPPEYQAYRRLAFGIDDTRSRLASSEVPDDGAEHPLDALFAHLRQRVATFVFMMDAPEACQARAKARGHESEKDIPLSYFEALDDVHFAALLYATHGIYTKDVIVLATNAQHAATNFATETLLELPSASARFIGKHVSRWRLEAANPGPVLPGAGIWMFAVQRDELQEQMTGKRVTCPSVSATCPLQLRAQYRTQLPTYLANMACRPRQTLEEYRAHEKIDFYTDEFKRTVVFALAAGYHVAVHP